MPSRPFDRAFYGLASHRGSWERCTIKGTVVRSRRRYLDTRAPHALPAILADLGSEARRYLEGGVLVSQRVPYGPLVEIDSAIVMHAMDGEVTRMHEFAHEIAAFDLDGGLYRGLLSALGGNLSLRLYTTLYQTYWQPGRVTASIASDRTTITLEDVVMPRYMCMHGFTGYIERMLEIASSPSDVVHRCLHDGATECAWVVTRRQR